VNVNTRELETTIKRLDEISTILKEFTEELRDTEEILKKQLSQRQGKRISKRNLRAKHPNNINRNRMNSRNLNRKFPNKAYNISLKERK
jgi:hypothetical protein